MGVDWYRMRPKPGVSTEELSRLIRQQAESFQGMPYYWAADLLTPDSYYEQARQRYERPYLESSKTLEGLLDFPDYDEEAGRCCDHPDLAPCWRVYPITCNTVFPPQWRLRAYRSFLSDELGLQIEDWTRWLSAVVEGGYGAYLLDLYLHEATKALYSHDQELRRLAEASIPMETTWAIRPALVAARERILATPAPQIAPAPILPPDDDEPPVDPNDDPRYQGLRQSIGELSTHTRDWNRAVRKQGWRLSWDRDAFAGFDGFLAQARDPWLLNFLGWSQTCGSLGMGLFLDY